jgi:glyoxylase-like metal-dependent hydrolase (beta-lactamase superfamily II)
MTPELIELKQQRPGFDRFIGSWVCPGEKNIVIDVGPAGSISGLVASLANMNIDRVDYVLITHIHIDHAGGVADFLDHFPMARVICHEKALDHLVEPSRLLAGSRRVLGDLVDTYGPIRPVKQEGLIPHTEARVKGLEIIETPGHSAHHLSYGYEGHLFPGEAGGIYLKVRDLEYTRPATPPQFFLKQFLESMDRLLVLEDRPFCFAHWGRTESSHHSLNRAREQLIRWEEILREEVSRRGNPPIEACMEILIEKDPYLKAFHLMDRDQQAKERIFMSNCIEGYLGFFGNNT